MSAENLNVALRTAFAHACGQRANFAQGLPDPLPLHQRADALLPHSSNGRILAGGRANAGNAASFARRIWHTSDESLLDVRPRCWSTDMHVSPSDDQRFATMLRRRAGECRELAKRAPLYMVATLPGESWRMTAEVLSEIADEIDAEKSI